MPLLRGNEINIGVGVEATRGTFAQPQSFIPGRTPSGINVELLKVLLKETKASPVATRGSEIVQRKASGTLEFNLRSETIGYLLLSLFGDYENGGTGPSAYEHTFKPQANNPQFPTLSLALSQGAEQHYGYRNAMVKSLEIKTPVDDLVNCTAEFIASDEQEKSDFAVTFSETDAIFKPQNVKIKLANNVSGLAAASAIDAKEFSIKINNNARAQQHIGSVTPTDNSAGMVEITGNLSVDYTGTTYHDAFANGSYKAMEITMTSGTNSLVITLDKVSFEGYSPDRPIDDIVKEGISFVGHFDDEAESAIKVVLTNDIEEYAASEESPSI